MASNKFGKTAKYRINKDIRATKVRLIDAEQQQRGIMSVQDALDIAKRASMDLVEISPNAAPPVVKVMDYGRHVFQKSKAKGPVGVKKKQSQAIKEVKLRPRTDEGDYQVKLRNLRRFLERGDKAKIVVCFRGYRELSVLRQLAASLLERIKSDLQDCGKVDQFPKLEGRQFIMLMSPGKSKVSEIKA
ncbi:MAG: translation initiation factor IF-3 [Legionellales bacterium]|nr:MAG: translation initiation factor IF-3 [Legionellales bacterium]